MSISIVQAARASAPYPWARFWRWVQEQGYDPQQFQTMLENGAEPAVVMAHGCAIDESVPYPGLPSLEGLTLDPEPGVSIFGGESR